MSRSSRSKVKNIDESSAGDQSDDSQSKSNDGQKFDDGGVPQVIELTKAFGPYLDFANKFSSRWQGVLSHYPAHKIKYITTQEPAKEVTGDEKLVRVGTMNKCGRFIKKSSDLDTYEPPSMADARNKRLQPLSRGDVLVSLIAPHRVSVFDIDEEAYASNDILVLSVADQSRMTPSYLAWYLGNAHGNRIMLGESSDMPFQKTVSRESIGLIQIPLIPLNQQEKLINEFSAISTLIEGLGSFIGKMKDGFDKNVHSMGV